MANKLDNHKIIESIKNYMQRNNLEELNVSPGNAIWKDICILIHGNATYDNQKKLHYLSFLPLILLFKVTPKV